MDQLRPQLRPAVLAIRRMGMQYRRLMVMLPLLAAAGACTGGENGSATDSQAAHIRAVVASGGTVDSIFPVDEHLRRFRATLRQADTLQHASSSIDALAARFVAAVAAHDTSALNAMLLDRAEFAWLYYPHSHMGRPPYEAPPELLWGQLMASSNQGVRKVLERLGGQSLRTVRTRCPEPPVMEGANRLHANCLVTIQAGSAAPAEGRWFGTILESAGRYKFIGFANDL